MLLNFTYLFYIIIITGLISCTSKIEVQGTPSPSSKKGGISDLTSPPLIDLMEIENGKLKLIGSNLDKIESLRLISDNLNAPLEILDENNSELDHNTTILADLGSSIYIALDKVFSLFVKDAYGAEKIYTVSFKLGKNSVTAEMLSHMDARDGDVLVFNTLQQKWEPKALSGLSYKGTWDASNDLIDVDQYHSGDYLVVSKDGNSTLSNITNWKVGDWAVYNGEEWQKIKNSNDVSSFNGRLGAIVPQDNDYTWQQIDKSNALLKDLADVAESSPNIGEVLKWDGTNWVPSTDNNAGGVGSVDSAIINNGSIVNEDISASANIDQSKIDGLSTSLAAKQNNITTGTTSQYLKGDLSIGTLDTNAVAEGSNLYYTDTRARGATVADSINDATTNIAPSQNAVFDALANKQNTITTGTTAQYFKGDLSLGTLDTDAVAEGSNLYYTDARAKSATVANSVTLGVTDIAPSQDAVSKAITNNSGFINLADDWSTDHDFLTDSNGPNGWTYSISGSATINQLAFSGGNLIMDISDITTGTNIKITKTIAVVPKAYQLGHLALTWKQTAILSGTTTANSTFVAARIYGGSNDYFEASFQKNSTGGEQTNMRRSLGGTVTASTANSTGGNWIDGTGVTSKARLYYANSLSNDFSFNRGGSYDYMESRHSLGKRFSGDEQLIKVEFLIWQTAGGNNAAMGIDNEISEAVLEIPAFYLQ